MTFEDGPVPPERYEFVRLLCGLGASYYLTGQRGLPCRYPLCPCDVTYRIETREDSQGFSVTRNVCFHTSSNEGARRVAQRHLDVSVQGDSTDTDPEAPATTETD